MVEICRFLILHLYVTLLLRVIPLAFRHSAWFGKTKMMDLGDGGKRLITRSTVLTEISERERDRQTNRQTDGQLTELLQRYTVPCVVTIQKS